MRDDAVFSFVYFAKVIRTSGGGGRMLTSDAFALPGHGLQLPGWSSLSSEHLGEGRRSDFHLHLHSALKECSA